MILSKHFLITFLKNTMRLPSFSSCFSGHGLPFSDEEFGSKHVVSVVAAILKLSALCPRCCISTQELSIRERLDKVEG